MIWMLRTSLSHSCRNPEKFQKTVGNGGQANLDLIAEQIAPAQIAPVLLRRSCRAFGGLIGEPKSRIAPRTRKAEFG